MIVTSTVLKKTGADRTIAFAGYGLLAASVFTAGLTGLAGVILAYASRSQVSPGVRRHLNAQIGIFWVALVLFLISVGAGIAATVIEIDDLRNGSGVYLAKLQILAWTIDVSAWRLVPQVVGLVAFSAVIGLAGALWTVVGPLIGVIRLATHAGEGVTAKS
ncbi:MAG: hypothetical protein Q8J89_10910 [Caulobacter sp.]|nr:hypothetical protein [Caulobacter sp.]